MSELSKGYNFVFIKIGLMDKLKEWNEWFVWFF